MTPSIYNHILHLFHSLNNSVVGKHHWSLLWILQGRGRQGVGREAANEEEGCSVCAVFIRMDA